MKYLKAYEVVDSTSVKVDQLVDQINDIRNEVGEEWELEAGELLDQLSNLNYTYSDTDWTANKL